MLQSQTQQKVCIHTLHLPDIGKLTYTLLEDFLPNGDRYYSMSISLEGSAGTEKCSVRDITGNRQFAIRLFQMICRGTVTPCTLTEVLEDLLA